MEGQIESDKEIEVLTWISPELVEGTWIDILVFDFTRLINMAKENKNCRHLIKEYREQFRADGCNSNGCDITLVTLDKNNIQA